MNDAIVEQLAVQVAELRNKVESLEAAMEESGGDSMDDLFLHIKEAGSGGTEQGAFRFEGTKITNCRFMFGRTAYSLADVENATGDGTWSLVIPHATPGAASVQLNTNQLTSLTQTVVPLFSVSNGEVAADWRGMPVVPVRE